VRYSLDAIRRRPGRSALTALGIGLAVGLVVLLLALSNGIQTSAATLAAESGVDLIGFSNNSDLAAGVFPPVEDAHGLASEIPKVDSNVVSASPWLIGNLLFGNQTLWADANDSSVPAGWSPTASGTVGWIPSDNSGIETPDLYNGTGFTVTGDPHYGNGSYAGPATHEIVLDQQLAYVLHLNVGSPVWLAAAQPPSVAALPGWYANATEFRVVGISSPFWLVPSALLAFTYLSELQGIIGGASSSTDYATLVLIHLTDPTNPTADETRIVHAFPGVHVITLGDILGEIQHVVSLYRTFGELIGAIGVVVAALFATTVLQMSVDDRSREIALLRAVGHSRASVGGMVVEEAVVLSLCGLAVGLPIAFVTAYGLNLYLMRLLPGLPTSFSFVTFDASVLLAGLALVVAVGLVAAIAPAARAMQLPVAEELRAP
jgi:putative ABC transport system permease protein